MKFFLIILTALTNLNAQEVNYTDALKLSSELANGKLQYQLCASCHFENGFGKIDGSFPNLAGQHKSVIIKQLADINTRERINPTMFPFATMEEIGNLQNLADIAGYIASMPENTHHGKGEGKNLKQAEKIYNEHCAFCHKMDGSGDARLVYPKLKNQHYAYLLRQLKWIKSGYRENSNPAMFAIVTKLSEQELIALADYISRL
jgi:cytochrome c553